MYTSTIDSTVLDTRYFQYQANMTTYSNVLTPRLDWVRIYFDVPDPDVQVSKSGPAGSIQMRRSLTRFTTRLPVGVPAVSVALTDAVPHDTSFLHTPGWQLAGCDVYTVPPGNEGELWLIHEKRCGRL